MSENKKNQPSSRSMAHGSSSTQTVTLSPKDTKTKVLVKVTTYQPSFQPSFDLKREVMIDPFKICAIYRSVEDKRVVICLTGEVKFTIDDLSLSRIGQALGYKIEFP